MKIRNKKWNINIAIILLFSVVLFACGSSSNTNIKVHSAYLIGADISSSAEIVDEGAIFVDTDGEKKGLINLLKNHGFNAIRLRTFVDPSSEYGYASNNGEWCEGKAESYNDKKHIIRLAQKVKEADMTLLLDLHYSDTWADPNKQVIPEAWRNLTSIETISEQLKNYTIDVVEALVNAEATPDIIQIGNEITYGMLIHVPTEETDCFGNNSVLNEVVNGGIDNWDNLSLLLKAGIEGVKKVDSNIKIMLHIESTNDVNAVIDWVEEALSHGVEFDVLGLSAYEKWQGPVTQWRSTLITLSETFPDLEFSIVEYNPQRRLVNDIIYDLPNSQGLGSFFWEPTLSGEWGESMFSQEGNIYTAKPDDFSIYDDIKADYVR